MLALPGTVIGGQLTGSGHVIGSGHVGHIGIRSVWIRNCVYHAMDHEVLRYDIYMTCLLYVSQSRLH